MMKFSRKEISLAPQIPVIMLTRVLFAAVALHWAAALTAAPVSTVASRSRSIRAAAVAEKPADVQETVATQPNSAHLAAIRAEGEAAILARRIRALTAEGRAARQERAFKVKLYSLKREGREAVAERAEKARLYALKVESKSPMEARVARYFAEMTRRAQMSKLLSLRIEGKAALKARRLMTLAYEGFKAIRERAIKASLFEQMRKPRTEAVKPAAHTTAAAVPGPAPSSPASDISPLPPVGFDWGEIY
jgi:phosphate/sulfate permease